MLTIACPQCGSEAFNHYGHTKNGKQRYICLVCSRQFINEKAGNPARQRPLCSKCGKNMHVYMRHDKITRYRCSDYPDCKGYAKIAEEN
jgi:transposase-like protein